MTTRQTTPDPVAESARTTSAFSAQNVCLDIGTTTILRDVTLDFPAGETVALVGHNGSGKSTLLKIMARQQATTSGHVRYGGRDIAALEARAFARDIAYMPQEAGAGSGMTVRELVACGRYPWHGALGRFTEKDRQRVEEALALTHMEAFADRFVDTLSGGERQCAWIAMLVAQDSQCLLLDEPTAALDIGHQIEVLSLVRQLSQEKGLSVIIVLHDINMAARFCDRIHALKGGRVVASGNPETIVQRATLTDIYGIAMDVIPHAGLKFPFAYAS